MKRKVSTMIWRCDMVLSFEQLEFIGSIKYKYEDYSELYLAEKRSGIKSAIIGAKFLVYDPNRNYQEKPNLYSWKANHKFKWRAFIPAVGVYAGVNLNLAKDKFYRKIPRICHYS